jgi:ABC-type amino acid transport substrate-binding protein
MLSTTGWRRCILTVIAVVSWASLNHAQSTANLRVGISPFSPFVIHSSGAPAGISIDLWEAVARRLEIGHELIFCEGVGDKLNRLAGGEIDVAIGGITISEEREKRFDFTHPIYHTGLGIMVHVDSRPALLTLIGSMFRGGKWVFWVGALALIVVAGHVIWAVERSSSRAATGFSRSYIPGVFEGMYWALVTASTVGYGDKVPHRAAGKLLTCAIILVFLPLFGFFVAELSSNLTLYNIKTGIDGPQDLLGKTVGVVKETTSVGEVMALGARPRPFDHIEDAIRALSEGGLDAVVYDAPTLHYFVKTGGIGRVTVIDNRFSPQDYGLAVPTGSPYREPLNRAILAMIEDGEMDDILTRWLGPR